MTVLIGDAHFYCEKCEFYFDSLYYHGEPVACVLCGLSEFIKLEDWYSEEVDSE